MHASGGLLNPSLMNLSTGNNGVPFHVTRQSRALAPQVRSKPRFALCAVPRSARAGNRSRLHDHAVLRSAGVRNLAASVCRAVVSVVTRGGIAINLMQKFILSIDKRVPTSESQTRVPWNKGLRLPPRSLETKAKIGKKARGRKLKPIYAAQAREQCKKMSNLLRGMKLTPEHRSKLSAVRIGIQFSEKHITAIRKNNASPERAKKLSAAKRLKYPIGTRKFDLEPRKRHTIHECAIWRLTVFERDNYTCQHCGFKSNLNAHHIKPWVKFPALRFKIDNGLTLCVPCHKAEHRRMRKEAKTI